MSHDLELKWQDAIGALEVDAPWADPREVGSEPAMRHRKPYLPDSSWGEKFRCAFRGLREGVRGQRSFLVHSAFALAVIACAAGFRVTLVEWCVLLLCITVVMTAEMFNSALEHMAKAISNEEHDYLGTALDIGSAAVLIASAGAVVVGSIVFLNRLAAVLGWW